MLKTRIITALVLLAILLLALFAVPDWAWAAFTLVILAAATWEWNRFTKAPMAARVVFYAVTAAVAGLTLCASFCGDASPVRMGTVATGAFGAGLAFWLFLAPLWLGAARKPTSPWLILVAGWFVILPAWLAILTLRNISPWLLLTFAAIVWVADIAAYFAGRRFGKHKLAPSISPGKTVEGAIGAVLGVVLFYFIWRHGISASAIAGSIWVQALLAQGYLLLALFIALTGFSIMGDLFESMMKRGAGLKDSSQLLPGHGGVLDRIDALTSTLPVAAAYLMLTGIVAVR